MYFPDQQDFIEEKNIFSNYYYNNNMNYYNFRYDNFELDNDVYEKLLSTEKEYYNFGYNIFMIYIYFIMYVYVFIIIDYLNEKNTINKIGNLTVREFYPFLIRLKQKCYEEKYHDKLILYFSNKKLRIYLRNLCENNYYTNKNINIKHYYDSIQNMYSNKLFNYRSLNEKKTVRIRSDKLDKTFKISIGELNYLIWTIDTKLFNYAYNSYNESFYVNYFINNTENTQNTVNQENSRNLFKIKKSYYKDKIYNFLNMTTNYILEKSQEICNGIQLYYEYHEDIFRN